MKKLSLIALLIAVGFTAARAETYRLTLDESIEIAKVRSYSMLRLAQDLEIAEFNLKSATSRLKTHINLNFTLPEYSETVRTWEDSTGVSFYSVKQLKYSSNLTIDQPLPTDGNVYIRTGVSGTDDYDKDIRAGDLNMRVGFSQPVDAFYGYNSIRSSLKRAQLEYERSGKSLKREELNLVYQVSSSYYNLLSLQKSTEIALLDLDRQTEAHKISQNKYEAGLIREVDALQMEVDLAQAQNSYDIALLNQSSATNSFKELLGIDLGDTVILENDLSYEIVVVDPDLAVSLALQNRTEIREQEIQISLQELNIKQQRAQGMVRGNVNGYYEKKGVSRIDRSSSLGSSLDHTFRDLKDRPRNFGVGLTISIPILDWGENKALVRAAEARLKQNKYRMEETERQIETEVRNLVASMNSNIKSLRLLEKNVEVAEKSFEITRQRYSDGDIDSQSLALERTRLNTAYTSHLRAYINYQLSLADLLRKTFYDFETNMPVE